MENGGNGGKVGRSLKFRVVLIIVIWFSWLLPPLYMSSQLMSNFVQHGMSIAEWSNWWQRWGVGDYPRFVL